MSLHDALYLGRIEGVDSGLSFSNFKLSLAVGVGGGDGWRIGKVPVMAEAVEGASFGVLSDVVIAEVTSCTEQRAKKRKGLRSRWGRHFRRTSRKKIGRIVC